MTAAVPLFFREMTKVWEIVEVHSEVTAFLI